MPSNGSTLFSGASLNAELKAKFRQLHPQLIGLNLSSVIDELFAEEVISDDDNNELANITNKTEKSRRLMALLHKSGHLDAFVKLRQAIANVPAYSWLIDRLDRF